MVVTVTWYGFNGSQEWLQCQPGVVVLVAWCGCDGKQMWLSWYGCHGINVMGTWCDWLSYVLLLPWHPDAFVMTS